MVPLFALANQFNNLLWSKGNPKGEEACGEGCTMISIKPQTGSSIFVNWKPDCDGLPNCFYLQKPIHHYLRLLQKEMRNDNTHYRKIT